MTFKADPEYCLNCGSPLTGKENYCPVCGQETRIKRLSLSAYLGQWINSVISLDSALPKSLWSVMVMPHKYAREFISGKRKKYTHPFKLLINLSIVFIVIQTFLFQRRNTQRQTQFQHYISETSRPGSAFEREFNSILDSIYADGNFSDRDKADRAIFKGLHILDAGFTRFFQADTSTKANLSITEMPYFYHYMLIAENQLNRYVYSKTSHLPEYRPSEEFIRRTFGTVFDTSVTKALEIKIRHPDWADDRILREAGMEQGVVRYLKFRLAHKLFRLFTNLNTPGEFMHYFISKMSVVIILFLPFYVLLFRIFWPSSYNYTETLVFIAIVQSFAIILVLITDFLAGEYAPNVQLIIFGPYYFLALKRFFNLGIFKTFVRWFFSGLLYLTVASVFLLMEGLISLYFV